MRIGAVIFAFVRDHEILLERRGDRWMVPAGKVEGEPLEMALEREVEEEMGVGIAEREALPMLTYHAPSGWYQQPYVIRSWVGDLSDRILDTGSRLQWFTLAEVLNEVQGGRADSRCAAVAAAALAA